MKKIEILKRGLFVGIIVFIVAEVIAQLGAFSTNMLEKTGIIEKLGSFVGGLLVGLISMVSMMCRLFSAIGCAIFKVSPVFCLPEFSGNFEFIFIGLDLFFWISVSMLFIYAADRKEYSKWFYIIIIIWLIGFFAAAKTTYYIADFIIGKRISLVDIQKQILGSWNEVIKPSSTPSASRKKIETYYPDKTFKIEITIVDGEKHTAIIHEGIYKIERNIVKYIVERTTARGGGWQFERKIIDFTNDRILYIDEYGYPVEATRIISDL